MYTVDYLGIIYFNVCESEQKFALVPDGKSGGDSLPAHSPSIFVAAANRASDDWWSESVSVHTFDLLVGIGKTEQVRFFEFQIPRRVTLTFDCKAGSLDASDAAGALVSLHEIDDQFQMDEAGAIAKIPLPGGALNAYGFGSALAVRWTIDRHADPIVIRASDGQETKSITLAGNDGKPIELVFSNTPDLLAKKRGREGEDHRSRDDSSGHDHGSDEECGHFELYGKINKGPNGATKFKCPDVTHATLEPLLFSHPYLRVLTAGQQIPNGNCSPTCC